MFLMIISLAAAEVAVGLGLVLQLFHRYKTLDLNILSKMKG
jgi:NADH-quinone oxidoreductase subunit K